MIRFITGLLLACVIASGAQAACSTGAMPFQLQNNTIADATQVMANFNQITSGVSGSCAGSGVNNDITALGALSTPITPAQGGTPVFTGVNTTGLPNAQQISVQSNFTLTAGNHVTGFWGATNTGPMTLQANGTAATNVNRKTQAGLAVTQGGEAVIGEPFDVVYNGTVWVLTGERIIVGEMRDFSGAATAPPGWLIADGSSFVCSTLQQLCNVIGTAYGGTSSNPNLPDTRGRVLAGLDNYGTIPGAANRLTAAVTGCGTAFTSVGVTCANASQSHTQIIAEIAAHNHTDLGHTHNAPGSAFWWTATVGSGYTTSNSTAPLGSTSGPSASGAANIQNTGSGQAMPIVNPNLGVVKIIRF